MLTSVPKVLEERRENGAEDIFEQKMAQNLPELTENMKVQIQIPLNTSTKIKNKTKERTSK